MVCCAFVQLSLPSVLPVPTDSGVPGMAGRRRERAAVEVAAVLAAEPDQGAERSAPCSCYRVPAAWAPRTHAEHEINDSVS